MTEKKIFTIPNLLSFFRICLLPVIVWLYVWKEAYIAAGCLLLVSGVTDLIDGPIARRFNMVSDLGKILDPVADKLTQAAMLFCLIFRFPLTVVPFGLMAAKEIFMIAAGGHVIKKTGKVFGAAFHGKVATAVLDGMVLVHVFWYNLPDIVSILLIAACSGCIVVSFALYGIQFRKALKGQE